jgi:L-fuculose-phosphate aldolase
MTDLTLRRSVIEAARRTIALQLTHGTSGNVSVRTTQGMLITPTGIPYHLLEPVDLVAMTLEGTVGPTEGRKPSSEWRMHAQVYRARPEITAVVHGHPKHATAIACMDLSIPAFHYMVAVAGGDSIRCAPYALFGSAELANTAVQALEERTVCLLANHGLLAIGASLDRAIDAAVEVEFLASVYLELLAAGSVRVLTPEQMGEVHQRFRTYGQQP